MKVYPFGYSAKGSAEYLDNLMQNENTILVDIRHKTYCGWSARWRRDGEEGLQHTYGSRYLWIPELGNLHHRQEDRHKGIKLADPEVGIKRLVTGLNKGYTLILLCGCRDYTSCHRKVVVDELLKVMPEVEIVQPEMKSVQIPSRKF